MHNCDDNENGRNECDADDDDKNNNLLYLFTVEPSMSKIHFSD